MASSNGINNLILARLVRAAIAACAVVGPLSLGAVWPNVAPVANAAGRVETRATIHWDGVPLGEAVSRLANVLRANVWLDCRVDPNQSVSLAARDGTIVEILSQLGKDRSLGVSQLERLVYLGPRESAEVLRTLSTLCREEVAQLPSRQRTEFDGPRAVQWPRLSQPRQLVVDLVRERGWQVRGAELIPHDLWPAGQLPRMTLADQLTVLLVGYDLTFKLDPSQRAVDIVAIERPVRLARNYRWPTNTRPDAGVLRQQFPGSLVEVDGESVRVDGLLEDHERLVAMLQPRRATQRSESRQRRERRAFTLRVDDKPAGAILGQLARQLGLTIDVDNAAVRAAGLSLDRRVSLSVAGADLDELLEAVLKPADLDFERDGQRVKVFPRRTDR